MEPRTLVDVRGRVMEPPFVHEKRSNHKETRSQRGGTAIDDYMMRYRSIRMMIGSRSSRLYGRLCENGVVIGRQPGTTTEEEYDRQLSCYR